MTSSRKQPGVAFWGTVALVAVLIAYPLSIGPVTWMHSKRWIPPWLDKPLVSFYVPCSWVYEKGPEPLRSVYRWYVDLWDYR